MDDDLKEPPPPGMENEGSVDGLKLREGEEEKKEEEKKENGIDPPGEENGEKEEKEDGEGRYQVPVLLLDFFILLLHTFARLTSN